MNKLKRLIVASTVVFLLMGVAHAQLAPMPYQGSNAAEGSHVFGGSVLTGLTITWHSATTARYLMLFDATALPSNGATTACSTTQASGCLFYCVYLTESITAPNRVAFDWTLHPVSTRNGVVAALSTGAGCGTLTADSANNFFYSQV